MPDIDEAIKNEQNRIVGLENQLADSKQRLDALIKAREIMRGSQYIPSQQLRPVPQSKVKMAEEVLKQSGTELHIDEIIKGVQSQFGVQVEKASITATLSKYSSSGKVFKKIEGKKNTFGLI